MLSACQASQAVLRCDRRYSDLVRRERVTIMLAAGTTTAESQRGHATVPVPVLVVSVRGGCEEECVIYLQP